MTALDQVTEILANWAGRDAMDGEGPRSVAQRILAVLGLDKDETTVAHLACHDDSMAD